MDIVIDILKYIPSKESLEKYFLITKSIVNHNLFERNLNILSKKKDRNRLNQFRNLRILEDLFKI